MPGTTKLRLFWHNRCDHSLVHPPSDMTKVTIFRFDLAPKKICSCYSCSRDVITCRLLWHADDMQILLDDRNLLVLTADFSQSKLNDSTKAKPNDTARTHIPCLQHLHCLTFGCTVLVLSYTSGIRHSCCGASHLWQKSAIYFHGLVPF